MYLSHLVTIDTKKISLPHNMPQSGGPAGKLESSLCQCNFSLTCVAHWLRTQVHFNSAQWLSSVQRIHQRYLESWLQRMLLLLFCVLCFCWNSIVWPFPSLDLDKSPTGIKNSPEERSPAAQTEEIVVRVYLKTDQLDSRKNQWNTDQQGWRWISCSRRGWLSSWGAYQPPRLINWFPLIPVLTPITEPVCPNQPRNLTDFCTSYQTNTKTILPTSAGRQWTYTA